MPDHRPLRPTDPTRLGPYRLVGRLGEGGQGVVYLGRSASGAPVAVKVLHPSHAADGQARRRFLREATMARRVAPFCTARVLAAGAIDSQLYLISEYIDGNSLHRQVSDHGPLDAGALSRLAVGTASALVAIHRAGIVHRDFKPSNVILGTDGPRVVDFGIARALDASTTVSKIWSLPGGHLVGQPLIADRPLADFLNSLPLGVPADSGHGPKSVAIAEVDGRTLAVSGDGREGRIRVWDVAAGEQIGEFSRPTGGADTIALGEVDGRPVAVWGSRDGTLQVRDLVTLSQIGDPLTGHTSAVNSVALGTLDGRTIAVSGSYDQTLRVWDLATGAQVGDPLTGHEANVWSVAVTERDGRTVAVSGGGDGTVRVWDLATGAQVGDPLTGHVTSVLSVAVGTLDGRTVVVSGGAGDDETLRVWDLESGEQIGEQLTGHETVRHVAVGDTEDGPVVVSGGRDGVVRAWSLRSLAQP